MNKKGSVIAAAVLAAVVLTGCMGQIEHLVKQGQTPDMATCSDVVKDGQTTTQQLAGLFGSPTKVTTKQLSEYNRHRSDGTVEPPQVIEEERTYQKGNLVVTVSLVPDAKDELVVVSHSCEIK